MPPCHAQLFSLRRHVPSAWTADIVATTPCSFPWPSVAVPGAIKVRDAREQCARIVAEAASPADLGRAMAILERSAPPDARFRLSKRDAANVAKEQLVAAMESESASGSSFANQAKTDAAAHRVHSHIHCC